MFSRDFTSHWIGTQYHPFQQGLAIPLLPIPMPFPPTILHFSLTVEHPAVSLPSESLWPPTGMSFLPTHISQCRLSSTVPAVTISLCHLLQRSKVKTLLSVIKSMGRWRVSSQPNYALFRCNQSVSGLLTSFPPWFRLSVRYWILLSGLPCLTSWSLLHDTISRETLTNTYSS